MPRSSMPTTPVVLRFLLGLMVCLWSASVAHAQGDPGGSNPSTQPPAYLSIVNGAATLERDGEVEPAVVNMPIVEGDILRTTTGRVEVVFPDGSAIEIDPDSEVEFISAARVRILRGAMEHRAAGPPETRSASADYLPQDLRMYGSTFDRNGSWQYQAPYGNVWYPSVAPDWRPYYYGSWSAVPSYGWTWIGADAWSWPTHHYGRWGYGRNAWFWIPGRTWGAAWVSWASASDFVSWCPLGFDGRPVFALSLGYNRGWNGWTVLSRSHFGARGAYTPHYSVDPRRIASNTPFIEHSRAPVAIRGRRESSVASRQSSVGSRQSSDASRQTAVDRRQPMASSPGRAMPRLNNDPRPGATDPRATAYGRRPTTNDPRPTTHDQRPTTNDQRPSRQGYRPPTTDYRAPTTDYRRGAPVAVPRSEMPRSDIPRADAPHAIPPSRTQIEGGAASPARSPERARPATAYQPPPAAYRPPPAASRAPASESRPSANGARAPERAAPASAPGRAAPRSGNDSGRASGAPAGAPHRR